jgi:hypothetical protein
MLYLGYWQLRRAESGNELSWAYTFEWPIFAICGVGFWVKSLREELSLQARDSGHHGSHGTEKAAAEEPGNPGADPDAYLARLKAEVQGHGRWHGIR